MARKTTATATIEEDTVEIVEAEPTAAAKPKRDRSRAGAAAKKDTSATPRIVAARVAAAATDGLQLATMRLSPGAPMTHDEAESVIAPTGRIISRQLNKYVKLKASEDTEDILEILTTIVMYILRIVLISLKNKEAAMQRAVQEAHNHMPTAGDSVPTPPMPPQQQSVATRAFTPPSNAAHNSNGNNGAAKTSVLEYARLLGVGDIGEAL